METLEDMGNKLLSLYKATLKEMSKKEEAENEEKLYREISEYDEDDEDDEYDEENEDEEKPQTRVDLICEYYRTLPDEERENMLFLMLIYFYMSVNVSIIDEKTGEIDDDKLDDSSIEIFKSCLNDVLDFCNDIESPSDKESVLEVFEADDKMLHVLIDYIFTDLILYNEPEVEIDYEIIADYMERIGKNKRVLEKVALLHPSMDKEIGCYNAYKQNEKTLKGIENSNKILPKSLDEFKRSISVLRLFFSRQSYFKKAFLNILARINTLNEELYFEIYSFMLKYVYAIETSIFAEKLADDELYKQITKEMDNNQMSLEAIPLFKIRREMQLALDNPYDMRDYIIERFISTYSMIKEKNLFADNDCIMKYIEKLTVSKPDKYGNEGIWKKCESSELKNIYRICGGWKDYISEDDKSGYSFSVFYTKDENNEYTIPRLIVATDKDNSVVDFYGRDRNFAPEFALLDNLQEKVKETTRNEELLIRIEELKRLGKINEKVENHQELNNSEIDFLFGINYPLSNIFFGKSDDRFKLVAYKAGIKKCLAKYFSCKEDEVATNYSELNDDTVIYRGDLLISQDCKYPKLRVVIGTIYAGEITDASIIPNLEMITKKAIFTKLKSAKGLEKLIRIGDDADFSSLTDSSELNPELVIEGGYKFKNNEIPKHLRKIRKTK